MSGVDRRPILVTGIPRSGTTWLARELAGCRGVAMPGREPMNPRAGQFALGGTLTAWTELTTPTPRQARLVRRCFQGREPRTFSRYGVKQWRAALPWTRIVVKDPFALLSVPAIVRLTGAVPVVVYRPAGAALASYRRMGWTADTSEIRALTGREAEPPPGDDAEAMVELWNELHTRTLAWVDAVPDAVLVSHAELSMGGTAALARLKAHLHLSGGVAAPEPEPVAAAGAGTPASGTLHSFRRAPEEVASGWRTRLPAEVVERMDEATAQVWQALEGRRIRVTKE